MADLFLRVLKYGWMVLWVFSPPYIIGISTLVRMFKAHCLHTYYTTVVFITILPLSWPLFHDVHWHIISHCPLITRFHNSVSLPIWHLCCYYSWTNTFIWCHAPFDKICSIFWKLPAPFGQKFHLHLKQRLWLFSNPPKTELLSLFVSLWCFDSGGYLLGVETYIITLFSLHLYQYT